VARAISRRLNDRGLDHLWLDATGVEGFSTRFPTIWRACATVGLDPTGDWLPVAPAAHYLCGGICTDLDGATTLPSLWACGEAACTGVHGANRLASNSLLENLVFAARVVEAITGGKGEPQATGVLRNVDLALPRKPLVTLPATRSIGDTPSRARPVQAELQRVMTREAGVLRSAASLERAGEMLAAMEPSTIEEANLLAVSNALIRAASARRESRGTHTRVDYPDASSEFLGRFVFTGPGEPTFVPLFAAAGQTASGTVHD